MKLAPTYITKELGVNSDHYVANHDSLRIEVKIL